MGGTSRQSLSTGLADTHCAVGNDGSLWCRSSNRWNELGAGVTVSPYFDTQVRPPGSVKVTCN